MPYYLCPSPVYSCLVPAIDLHFLLWHGIWPITYARLFVMLEWLGPGPSYICSVPTLDYFRYRMSCTLFSVASLQNLALSICSTVFWSLFWYNLVVTDGVVTLYPQLTCTLSFASSYQYWAFLCARLCFDLILALSISFCIGVHMYWIDWVNIILFWCPHISHPLIGLTPVKTL